MHHHHIPHSRVGHIDAIEPHRRHHEQRRHVQRRPRHHRRHPMRGIRAGDDPTAMPPGNEVDLSAIGQAHRVVAAEVHLVAHRQIIDLITHRFDHPRTLIARAERIGTAVQFADLAADQTKFGTDTDPGEMRADRNLVGSRVGQDNVVQREVLSFVADQCFGIHGFFPVFSGIEKPNAVKLMQTALTQ